MLLCDNLGMEAPKVIFTEMLFELMDREGVDIEAEFARTLEIPPTTVNRWTFYKGVAHDPRNVYKLMRFFNVSYEFLMFGIGLTNEEREEIIKNQEEKIKSLEFEKAMLEKAQLNFLDELSPKVGKNRAVHG